MSTGDGATSILPWCVSRNRANKAGFSGIIEPDDGGIGQDIEASEAVNTVNCRLDGSRGVWVGEDRIQLCYDMVAEHTLQIGDGAVEGVGAWVEVGGAGKSGKLAGLVLSVDQSGWSSAPKVGNRAVGHPVQEAVDSDNIVEPGVDGGGKLVGIRVGDGVNNASTMSLCSLAI